MVSKTGHFKRGSFQKNFLFYFLSSVAILAVVAFLIYTDFRVSRKKSELSLQISALEKEIKNLQDKNVQLKAQISEEQTESYLEREGRDTLGFKKPGEEVVVVLPPTGAANNATSTSVWQNLGAEISDFFKKILGK
jgi:cell division protein FtsB